MARLHRLEVPTVKSDENVGSQSFCCGDDGRIRAPERKVCVLVHESRYPTPILREWRLYIEFLKTSEEARFGSWSSALVDQVGGLCHAKSRYDKAEEWRLESGETGAVRWIGRIRDGDQRTTIHDRDRYHQPIELPKLRPDVLLGPSRDH